jgi:NADH-quinone oxidoreductase subunit N
MFVLVMSIDLISFFMGFELMSLPIYALAAFDRRSLKSSESGLKYFLLGAFASAILLYGMALLYGATGHTDFAGIAASPGLSSSLARAGVALMVVGLAFKVSAVPFHHWTPDVYEGAPTTVTAFMLVTVKCSAFVVLIRLLSFLSPEMNEALSNVFWVLAALTMLVGNLMAVLQNDVKRLIAYSSVSHAGIMLIAVVVGSPEAHASLLFYLMIYVFMNAGVFGVLVALSRDGEECERIDDLAGLARRRPGLAAALTLFMFALAGVPGTGGFMAKFLVFSAAVGEGYIWLTILGVATSVVAAFYYLRLPVAMYMGESIEEVEESDATRELGSFEMAVLILCSVAVFYLGILPDRTPFLKAVDVLPQHVSETRVPSPDPGLSAAQDADVALSAGDVELVE